MKRHVDEGGQEGGGSGRDTGSLSAGVGLPAAGAPRGPTRTPPQPLPSSPSGSARKPPRRPRPRLHSSAVTCCGGWRRRRWGWSAHRSCPRGAPSRTARGMGRALPGASSGQLLQGNTSHSDSPGHSCRPDQFQGTLQGLLLWGRREGRGCGGPGGFGGVEGLSPPIPT